jgi:hypothetical protein
MLKLNALADLLRNAYKRYRLGHDVTAVTAGVLHRMFMKIFAVIHGGGDAVTEHSYTELPYAVPAHGMELVNRLDSNKQERATRVYAVCCGTVQQDPDS